MTRQSLMDFVVGLGFVNVIGKSFHTSLYGIEYGLWCNGWGQEGHATPRMTRKDATLLFTNMLQDERDKYSVIVWRTFPDWIHRNNSGVLYARLHFMTLDQLLTHHK